MLTLWHNLIKSETWTKSATLFFTGALVWQLYLLFYWPSLTCQKCHLVSFSQGPDTELPQVNLRTVLQLSFLQGDSRAWHVWRVCVTAGFVGCGRGASEGFPVAQWVSPLHPGWEWLQRACVHSWRWINVRITGWELGWWVMDMCSLLPPLLWALGLEIGWRIWQNLLELACDYAEGHRAEQTEAGLVYWSGILSVCSFCIVRGSLVTCRNDICASLC